ncbi:MAG TPA: radical SAM protein [Bacteroidia bacterium]|nr:radical SAM protein [Bacteroidia bacterium]
MNNVLLFNPRAANTKPRIPNSILQVAASIDGIHEWMLVDGNLEADPWASIENIFRTGEFKYFACTVMPGPQLKQAIPFSKKIRSLFPSVIIIWGGYFPSNQSRTVLNSGFVDYVINGPGDKAFPALLLELERGTSNLSGIPNIIYKSSDQSLKNNIIINKKDELYDQDTLPELPYKKLNSIYPLSRYLGKTYLGSKTIAYHSSFGCPFTCSFCAVVPIYKARWRGKSAENIYKDILKLKHMFGGNAIEFHDNNFFVSEKRTADFSRLMLNEGMNWWGEGRIDTIDKYSDDTLDLMQKSGCRMIFFGAETGNDEILKKMDKGGTQSSAQIRAFAARMKKFDIVPEYSFVLGTPADSEAEVWKQLRADIEFIREIKEINPETEIIIYIYSPVPAEGSSLYNDVLKSGFRFPEKLEDWIEPQWEKFDLRKNPLTPWLTEKMVDYIRNFETVLNGYYPTVSDIKLSPAKIKVLKKVSYLRYRMKIYGYPYEIKSLQKVWRYRQPEIEGF